MNNLCPHYPTIVYKEFNRLLTRYSQDFHKGLWIRGTLVLLGNTWYDKEKYRKDELPMAMLSDEMLLESYYMATELHLDREFIALLLAEIHRRNLNLQEVPNEFYSSTIQ